MNGVDYTKRLDRQRELYQRDIESNNRANQERLESAQASFDHKIKSQKDAHLKQKTQMENDFTDRYEDISTSQKEALTQKNKAYEEAISSEKKRHYDLVKQDRKEFNQKLNDLNTTFKRNTDQHVENDRSIRNQLSENYDKRVDEIRLNADNNLKAYQANAIGDNKERNEKMLSEKRQLISDHEKDMNTLQKEEIEKRNMLKDRIVRDVAKMRETQETENIASRARQKERFNRLTNETDQKVALIERLTQEEVKRLAEAQQKEIRDQNQAFSDRFTDQEKRFNRSLREQELQHRAQGIGAGGIQHEIMQKQREVEKDTEERKIQTVIDDKIAVEKAYGKLMDQARQNFQDNYRDMRLDHADEVEKNERTMTEINQQERKKDRLERAQAEHQYKIETAFLKDQATTRLNSEQEKNKNIVQGLKENFNKSINRAREESQVNFRTAREEMNKEKRVLQERLHQQNTRQIGDMRQIHDRKLASVREGLNDKIYQLENKNKEMQMNYENKIRDLVQKTSDEIARQQKEFRISADNEIRLEREASRTKEGQLRQQMKLGQKNFDQKLNDQRLLHNRKLNETTFNYERKLKNQQDEFQEIIENNRLFFEREKERLNLASQMERERLISQYENHIKKLHQVNRDKIREMEDFARANIGKKA